MNTQVSLQTARFAMGAALAILLAVPAHAADIRLFTTGDTRFDGNLGGLSGADAKCNAEAANLGLSGTWVALLSTDTVDARDRIADGRYIRTTGEQVAASKADLFGNYPLDNEPRPRFTGFAPTWTGSTSAGLNFPGSNCSNWTTNASAPRAVVGESYRTDGLWIQRATHNCAQFDALYCFESSAAPDADGDGVPDAEDVCPGGDDNVDTDVDGVPDFCDSCPLDVSNDSDGDGVCDGDDNCPAVANENQSDQDGDGLGDVCDSDLDGDGVVNDDDNCAFDANGDQADFDADGAGDVCDADVDGDGVIDADDACVPTDLGAPVDTDGCSIAQLCPCTHPDGGDKWKNHGAYVSCVALAANAFRDAGLISEEEHGEIVSEAGQSACGHKNR